MHEFFIKYVFVVTMFHVKHSCINYGPLVDFLLEQNKHINLTAIRNREEVLVKHIEDSLVIANHLKQYHPLTRAVLDLGTGAGFPGLVIAAENPAINVTLLDSTQKKIHFVDKAIALMGITNATTVSQRAESLALADWAKFDVIVARSVARLDILLKYADLLLKQEGTLLAMKLLDSHEELLLGQTMAKTLGFSPCISFPYTLSQQNRVILSFKKQHNPTQRRHKHG
jgi:16S rRNA (guanine527-N7)-methyltransferase